LIEIGDSLPASDISITAFLTATRNSAKSETVAINRAKALKEYLYHCTDFGETFCSEINVSDNATIESVGFEMQSGLARALSVTLERRLIHSESLNVGA
jgi:hypothetical protein